MSSTPLIRGLQVQGGTIYTMSSASDDLTRALQTDTKKFRFSHYALLDLPNIDTPTFGENDLQFDTIDGAWFDQTSSAELNLVQSFQNYVLNFETMLNNRPQYDPVTDRTVAEKVFWKWLKELGVMRWENADATEVAASVTTPRYTELDDTLTGTSRYNKVVKYVGRVDMKNAVKTSSNTYEEVFILIPSTHGNTPTVLFSTEDTNNYPSGTSITNNPSDPTELDYIVGRGPDDIHPAGLSMQAYFDVSGVTIPTTINGISANIYPYGEDNSYVTEASFTNTAIETIVKQTSSPIAKTITYQRSRLDGVTLDLNEQNYQAFAANPSFKSFADYNQSDESSDFKFNTVLLYYEIYDPADPSISTTNLYGILFVNPVELVTGGSSDIQRLVKIKPNSVTKSGGTSYGLRWNLKISTSLDQVQSEVTVNDYSTFSMQLFLDSMNNLLSLANSVQSQSTGIIELNQKVLDLEDLIATGTTVTELQVQVDKLTKSLLANQALFENSQSIVQMIANIRTDMNNFLKGITPIQMSLDLSSIKAGYGIVFDNSIQKQLTISAASNGYVVSNSVNQWPLSGILTYKLQRGNNLLILRSLNPTSELSDRFIYIDDSQIKWIAGQVLRVSVNFDLDMNGFSLYMLTDASGITNSQNTKWTNTVGQFSELYMRRWSYDNSIQHDSCFDIVCLTPPTPLVAGTFQIDKIR